MVEPLRLPYGRVSPVLAAALSALLLAEIAADIFPEGVFSVVVGDGPEVPRALLGHPKVRRIGPASEESTQMVPLVSQLHPDRTVQDITDVLDDGARLLGCGKRPAALGGGFFPEPTVLDVPRGMRIARKEVFGPSFEELESYTQSKAISIFL